MFFLLFIYLISINELINFVTFLSIFQCTDLLFVQTALEDVDLEGGGIVETVGNCD